MTWPVTFNPGIHEDTQSVQQQTLLTDFQLETFAEPRKCR